MQNSKVLKVILFICGALILLPGLIALFNPVGFTARNGVDIIGNISMLNDYRGMGGMLLGSGIIILLGVLHHRMAFTSTVVAIVMFLTLALGRFVSIVLDGMPADGLFKATVVEAILGFVAIFAMIKFREKE